MNTKTKIHFYPDKMANSSFYQKLARSPFLLYLQNIYISNFVGTYNSHFKNDLTECVFQGVF